MHFKYRLPSIDRITFLVLLLTVCVCGGGCNTEIKKDRKMNDKELVRQYIQKHWVHSHEEDSINETVYRPATFKFPPSRGRMGYEFKPDGKCTVIAIGPTDRSELSDCGWELKDRDGLTVVMKLASGEVRTLEVERIDEDKMVIKKKP